MRPFKGLILPPSSLKRYIILYIWLQNLTVIETNSYYPTALHQELLHNFKKVCRDQPKSTLLEICGYPHYENVASNILRHFLDSDERHGLQGLFIKALIRCLDDQTMPGNIDCTYSVEREVYTNRGKRLDLVIECPGLIIGIENKIWHRLNNNLPDYLSQLRYLSPDARPVVVILSLSSVTATYTGKFYHYITYEQLFAQVKSDIGSWITVADQSSLLLLTDFIKTIENLIQPNFMDPETLQFFDTHFKQIESLYSTYKSAMNQLTRRLNMIKDAETFNKEQLSARWIWDQYILVHDFAYKDDLTVVVDFALNFSSCYIEVFMRDADLEEDKLKKLHQLFEPNPFPVLRPTARGYIVFEEKKNFDQLDVAFVAAEIDKVLKLVDAVIRQQPGI